MSSTPDDKDEKISNFCGITGVEAERGEFYLESAHWDLQLAVQSFFENGTEDMPTGEQHVPPVSAEEQQRAQELREMFGNRPVAQQTSNTDDNEMAALPDITSSATQSGSQAKSGPKAAPKPASNFATLDSLRKQTDSGESSDEDGQAFYAGGSEHSGQQVLGPKKPKNTKDLVSNVFTSAKEHGAEVVDPSEEVAHQRRPNAFSGTGFKLGSTSQESTSIAGPAVPVQRTQEQDMILKFWSNGFSIDDGPLRQYNDSQNQDFLNSIKRGEIPRELIQKSGGKEVHLNLEDHKTEEYSAPKRRVQAFAGEGFRLGNPTAQVVTTATHLPQVDPKEAESEAIKQLNVNPSLPTTNIQIRLSDGSRLVIKLNLVHTISQIRQYICTYRPAYSSQNFVLMTTFPNKQLEDESLTIEAANLANASIVQKIN